MAMLDQKDLQPIIAGALFDFLGRLTSLPVPVVLGGSEEPHRALVLLQGWAAGYGLDLSDAKVKEWHESLEGVATSHSQVNILPDQTPLAKPQAKAVILPA